METKLCWWLNPPDRLVIVMQLSDLVWNSDQQIAFCVTRLENVYPQCSTHLSVNQPT